MKFDVFFSICQTEVDGHVPTERVMFENFFDQVRLADDLGFGCAWVAETHLSCQVQKRNPGAVIPHFKGEIGLNTDILQLGHRIFAQTRRIHVGSAIRNILCNGGPIAHAEAVRTFLSLHGLDRGEERLLELGFASGRFPFSNIPYGIRPRNEIEALAWPALRGLIFLEATEIFLRFLKGEVFNSRAVTPKVLTRAHFRSDEDWMRVVHAHARVQESASGSASELVSKSAHQSAGIEIPPYWVFDDVGVIPFDAPMHLLRLTIGAHDAASQAVANKFLPVGVFNLSITPGAVIEETHHRMKGVYHVAGGPWTRHQMPRTVLVFIDNTKGHTPEAQRAKAQARAHSALSTYWKAIEGTLDPVKIENAVDNALVGSPTDIVEQIKTRFHPQDRLMLWFDFNNHDNAFVKQSMRWFMEDVAPRVET
ncbi:MAG: LLM class flavin-dependent oxidoreductase [Bdellovibrionaceae bacterium]|nr:LLM class flavin-dependent oxidoreductase [Pseudobdellovibrionaceae bacterium]